MTDEAKAVEMLDQTEFNALSNCDKWRYYRDASGHSARSFLALSEKCKRYEKVVEAARSAYGFIDDSIQSSFEKLAKRNLHDALKALDSELEPGDSDG